MIEGAIAAALGVAMLVVIFSADRRKRRIRKGR